MRTGTATVTASRGVNLPGSKRKPNKYRNVPTVVDGIWFRSKREARRYGELLLLQRANKIEGLTLQRPFDLEVNGVRIAKYVADFDYFDRESGQWVVEDAKGVRTAEYRLKKALMRACRGIEIREV